MATHITDECINCGACEPECPNDAISEGDSIYVIDPKLCSECVGFFDHEACQAVCPVECCVPDPNNSETEAVLLARAKQLHPDKTLPDLASLPATLSRFRAGGQHAMMIGNVKVLMALNPAAVKKLSPEGDALLNDVCAACVLAGGSRDSLVESAGRVTLSAKARAWCQTTPIYRNQAGSIYVLFEEVDSKTRESEKLEFLGTINPKIYLVQLAMKFDIPREKIYD